MVEEVARSRRDFLGVRVGEEEGEAHGQLTAQTWPRPVPPRLLRLVEGPSGCPPDVCGWLLQVKRPFRAPTRGLR